MALTVSEYLVKLIAKTGVDWVPVITGGNIMKVIDDLGRHPRLSYICPNHEQALAMMVEAYARLKGFGVGLVTSGPGGTNLMTGIGCAYYDSIPCLFITGQVGRYHSKGNRQVRQRGFQETDIVNIAKPITKWSVTVENSEDIRFIFEKAVYLAKEGRPGPVLIDLPYDIQRALINPKNLKEFIPPKTTHRVNQSPLSEVLKTIRQSQKPLLLVGGGVRLAGQADNVHRFVQKTKIPVVTTWGAADIFDWDDPCYLGNIGRGGNPSANKLLQECDLLLALGTRFTTKEIVDEKLFAKNARIIAVDIDESELNDGLVSIHQKLAIDLKNFVPLLLRGKKFIYPNHQWRASAKNYKEKFYNIKPVRPPSTNYLDPYELVAKISEILSEKDIVVADCGTNLIWTVQAYKSKKGRRLITAWGHSPMGYALPAAIGAYYGKPRATVVATIGDGGIQMNIQELQTIAVNKIPVKIFILNNQCYANLKFPTRQQFANRTFATEPGNGYQAPDFIKIARAYGLRAVSLKNNRNLAGHLKEILSSPEAVIVDVNCDPELYVFEDDSIK